MGAQYVFLHQRPIWDAENRMTSFGSLLTAGYRADGLRAWKQTSAGRTYFIYDGQDPILELDASGNISAVNTFGPEGLASRRAGGVSTFYVFDPQGNVVQRWNGATLASSDLSDAFGASVSNVIRTDPFGFGAQWGYYSDLETGLQLLGHRYYDGATGRFLNRDPISYGGGINLYSYVGNNPSIRSDSSGYLPAKPCTKKQQDAIKKQLEDVCKVRIPLLPSKELRECLQKRCKNIKIICHGENSPPCDLGDAGDTMGPGGGFTDTIHICPSAFDSDVYGCLGKSILHEMIHSCGDIKCPNADTGPGALPAGPGSTEGMTQIAYGAGTPPCLK